MDREKTVSLCMIVKNEEKLLARCLTSVKNLTDEIILVDTGSTDNTVEIARSFGAKIYAYKWNNNFSNARNFSISKATSDWILLLDADEALDNSDNDRLTNFINNSDLDGAHFTIYNYMGPTISDNYSIHNGFRLLRNNHQYKFKGEIHEQIVRIDGHKTPNRFAIEEIKLHHYGYLDDVVKDKNKRSRNLLILEKQLKKNPDNSFTIFNLGNEYLALSNYNQALEYYCKAYINLDINQAFTPHLIFRMVNCYENLKQYENALKYIEEGLRIYPKCTDLEFVKACIFHRCNKYSLAIDSYKKCFDMGEPPASLKFVNGCGTFRASEALGELHFELEEYTKALEYFNKTLSFNMNSYGVIYKIGTILNRLFPDKNEMFKQLYSYFYDINYEPNVIIVNDILINEGFYDLALQDLTNKNKTKEYHIEFKYLTAKVKYLKRDFSDASKIFKEILADENITKPLLLPNLKAQSSKFLFDIGLITDQESLEYCLGQVKKFSNEILYRVCSQFYNLSIDMNETILSEVDNTETVLAYIMEILGDILKVSEYDIFEKMLYILNKVNSDTVLLQLSRLYYNSGFKDMAVKTILRSIRELNAIDSKCIKILSKEII